LQIQTRAIDGDFMISLFSNCMLLWRNKNAKVIPLVFAQQLKLLLGLATKKFKEFEASPKFCH
jgi:hypothetical protein